MAVGVLATIEQGRAIGNVGLALRHPEITEVISHHELQVSIDGGAEGTDLTWVVVYGALALLDDGPPMSGETARAVAHLLDSVIRRVTYIWNRDDDRYKTCPVNGG